MRLASLRPLALAVIGGLALAPALQAQTVARGVLVAEEGGSVALPGGGTATVVSLGLPVTNGSGQVAFTGSLATGGDPVGFVFVGDAVRWRNSDAATPLAGREAWMGAASDGAFVYSPTVNGEDGLWTDLGLLVRRGDPAPGASGPFVAFASRPGMSANGTAHWVGGLAETATGPATARAFYVSPARTAASTTVVLAEGQPVGGVNVTALDFNYSVSGNGAHRAFLVTRATGSAATDGAVVLDGAVVAQEGSAVVGGTELWQSFDLVHVNNAGHHLIAGDTNGPTTADEVIAYDGAVVLREGMSVGGVTLGAEVRGIALNDASITAYVWTTSAGPDDEALFAGFTANLAASSQPFLRTGQGLDTSGDGAADYTVTDFEFSSNDGHGAISFGSPQRLYVRVSLTPVAGGAPRDAIVGIDYSRLTLPSTEPGSEETAGATLDAAPNPFRGESALTLTLDRAEAVTVDVLDVLGRRVALLHDGPLAAGPARLRLDGAALPAGLYLVRATGEGWTVTRRVARAD